jgi:GNAT superfamily N-acetyltransferase
MPETTPLTGAAADRRFHLRPAHPGDAEAIVGLIRELADYERLTHLVQTTPADLARHLFGERPVIECTVACPGGAPDPAADATPIAFALFFTTFSTFLGRPGLWLEDLYVQPAWRGAGVGRALLRHGARLATARGCGRYEWSVLDWNEPAIGFYRGLGADVLPDWRICRVTGESLDRLGGAD